MENDKPGYDFDRVDSEDSLTYSVCWNLMMKAMTPPRQARERLMNLLDANGFLSKCRISCNSYRFPEARTRTSKDRNAALKF